MRWTFQRNILGVGEREREGGKPNIKAHFSKYQGKIVERIISFPPEKEEKIYIFQQQRFLPEPGPLAGWAGALKESDIFLLTPSPAPPGPRSLEHFLLSGNSRLRERESLNFLFCPKRKARSRSSNRPWVRWFVPCGPHYDEGEDRGPWKWRGGRPRSVRTDAAPEELGAGRCSAGSRCTRKKGFPSVATL